ncbi:MAG: hypothetical protein Sapg2KO_35030 [Saprospiraceae bacterium]
MSLLIATAQINWTVWKTVIPQETVVISPLEEIPSINPEDIIIPSLSGDPIKVRAHAQNWQTFIGFWQQNWRNLYWSGVFAFAVVFLFRLAHIQYLIYYSTPIQKGQYTLLEHPNLQTIFSFGRYIFNPKGRVIHPMILDHELVHIRQRHSMDLLWMELLVIFNWFNPILYLYQKNLKETHEFIADKSMVQRYGLLEYARLVVSQATKQKSPALGTPFAAFTKKRILTMKTNTSNPWSRLRYGIVLPLFLVLLTAFATKRVEKERPSPVVHEGVALVKNQVAAQIKWSDLTCDCFTNNLKGAYFCDIKTVSKKQLEKLTKQIPNIKIDGKEQSLLVSASQYTATVYRSDSKVVGLPVEFSSGFFDPNDLFWRKLEPGDKIKFRATLTDGQVVEFPIVLEGMHPKKITNSYLENENGAVIPTDNNSLETKSENQKEDFHPIRKARIDEQQQFFALPINKELLQSLSSGYGMRIHPINKKKQFHRGVDFTAPLGTTVKASAMGEVIEVERLTTGYGKKIVIQHAEGYQTLYAQLQSINVKVGEKVRMGQHIGTVGSSGQSTGPHLHFELLKDDKPLDPEKFLPNWKEED